MEGAFLTLIRTQAGVPVYWRVQPIAQKAFPFANLSMVSKPTFYAIDSEYREALIQVDAWAKNYTGAAELAATIHTALSGYTGTVSGVLFKGMFAEGERDIGTGMTSEAGSDPVLFGRSQDFRVVYQ